MSSSPSIVLNREKIISVNIFIPIQYFKHFYLISVNVLVSSVVNPHSFRRISYGDMWSTIPEF